METRKEVKRILDSLDEQYKKEVKAHTGLSYAGNDVGDTARLYRLIGRVVELEGLSDYLVEKDKHLDLNKIQASQLVVYIREFLGK